MRREDSFIVIVILYLVAFLAGYALFNYLNLTNFLVKMIIVDIFATIIVWLFSLIFKNSSVYDPYWSVAPLVMIPFFIQKFDVKTMFLLSIVFIWGIRLTINWAFTFKGMKYQDWRYTTLKENHPKLWFIINLFGIHLFPTLVVIGVMLPAFVILSSNGSLNAFSSFGILVAIIGILLETVADLQNHGFRKSYPGKVIQMGLWKYSRHPNYLGEILMWWGVSFMMLSISPMHYYYFIGPLVNTLMFLFISIPLMEKRQLKNKPDYSSYRKRTSKLLLLPQRKKLEN